jgi:predicted lipoprotein
MRRLLSIARPIACVLAVAAGVAGCKFVKTAEPGKNAPIAADESGDDARIAALIGRTWDSKLAPFIRSTGIDAGDLKRAIAADLDAAGRAHGHRGAGEGAAWNFVVKGSGKVVAADRQSRAAHADLDIDGDGGADVVVQLGPVVRGTALRDVAPFYGFTDFRDQIEFAKLARALNDTAVKGLKLPDGDLAGRTLRFAGAAAVRSAGETLTVVPIDVEVAP